MDYFKFLLKNKHLYFLLFLSLYFSQACASPIENEYKATVNSYNKAVSKQEYVQAYQFAETLLSMDPSDTLSLLRLAYSSKMLNKKDKSLIEEYMRGIARASTQDKEIISFITAIQASKN